MDQLEKVLSGILNSMKEDDAEIINIDKTIQRNLQKHDIEHLKTYKAPESQNGMLDEIIKDSVSLWLDKNFEFLIKPLINKAVEKKVNIPVDYIQEHLKKKFSNNNLLIMLQKILKNAL